MTARSLRSWTTVVARLARRPDLWTTALRQARRLAAPGWWHRPPFLPLPAPGYLGFRMLTQYGDPGARPEPDDVVDYLTWCRRYDQAVAR